MKFEHTFDFLGVYSVSNVGRACAIYVSKFKHEETY